MYCLFWRHSCFRDMLVVVHPSKAFMSIGINVVLSSFYSCRCGLMPIEVLRRLLLLWANAHLSSTLLAAGQYASKFDMCCSASMPAYLNLLFVQLGQKSSRFYVA